jgi:hypothetical protein
MEQAFFQLHCMVLFKSAVISDLSLGQLQFLLDLTAPLGVLSLLLTRVLIGFGLVWTPQVTKQFGAERIFLVARFAVTAWSTEVKDAMMAT